MVEVVAALIEDDGKFMIFQRPQNKSQALLWEFVGGKVEKGETKQQALVRECKEEIDVDIEVEELFAESIYNYPEKTVHLAVFKSKILQGEVKLLEHIDFKWITKEEFCSYEFCPADISIVEKIENS